MKINNSGIALNVQIDGAAGGPPVVFANSLGTDLRMWDAVVAGLPQSLCFIRYDMRGHGGSDVPPPPYKMGQLIHDAEAICDALEVKSCVFVGLSVGGMVAQGLAVKRPDLIRAMVLSNTAAKIGTPKMWQDRIDKALSDGLAGLVGPTMARWFGRSETNIRPWAEMFTATSPEGYAGMCHAIAGTDFYTATSGLRIPTLGIASAEDQATPPDLVRETVDLIPGSQFTLMRRAGHIPCASHPEEYARILTRFLESVGHTNTMSN